LSRLTQVADASGAYSFTYDNLGRLLGTGTQYSFLSGTLTNSYAYDAAGNRTSLTDPPRRPPFEFLALSAGSQIRRGGRGWRATGNHPVARSDTGIRRGALKNSPPQMRRGGALSAGVVLIRE
jgi:RHS Repeat